MNNSSLKKISSFFIKGHQRTLIAKKNVLISLIAKGGSMCATFLLVPMTINYVNPKQYGIWLTLSSIVGWFNFFDMGLGHGLKNRLAESNALGENEKSRIYISTTYTIIAAVTLIIFIVFSIISKFIDWTKVLNTSDLADIKLSTLVLIVFGAFCLQLITQLIFSILTAFHMISIVSVVNGLGQVCSLISVFLLTKFTHPSLLYLVLVLIICPILCQVITSIIFFSGRFHNYFPRYSDVDFRYAGKLLSIGGGFFFIQIGALLLFQTDNIVLTQVFGPQEVTTFNVTYRLFYMIIAFFTIFMDPFWAAFTDAYTKKDFEWINHTFVKIYKVWGITIIGTLITLFLSPYIYNLWVGNSVKVSFMASTLMAIYAIGVCWMTIHNYFVNGLGKIRVQIILYAVSTIINIPLAIVLAKVWGISGVIFSNFFIVLMMGSILYVQTQMILKGKALGVWNK